jgi:hypothetical protein
MFGRGVVVLEVESPKTLPNVFIAKFSYIHIFIYLFIFSLLKWTLGKEKRKWNDPKRGKK